MLCGLNLDYSRVTRQEFPLTLLIMPCQTSEPTSLCVCSQHVYGAVLLAEHPSRHGSPSPNTDHVGQGHFQPCRCLKLREIYADRYSWQGDPPDPLPSSRAHLDHISHLSSATINALWRTSIGVSQAPPELWELGTSLVHRGGEKQPWLP